MIDLGSNGIVQISETGDRVSDYSLFDLNPKSGQFEVIKYSRILLNSILLIDFS
jgi:hypothetical protein